jgi:electron transfer flavoprotein alpha subunit
MKILLITEQREGKWNKVSFETLAAAQQIVQQTKGSLTAVVLGKGVAPLADEIAAYQLDELLLVEHDLLEKYTPDGFSPSPRLRAQTRRFAGERNDRRLHSLSL